MKRVAQSALYRDTAAPHKEIAAGRFAERLAARAHQGLGFLDQGGAKEELRYAQCADG